MRFSTLIYTFKQGLKNIFRNKWYSLASIATIGACLFMFGIFYAVVANFQYIVKGAQDGVAVTVFFKEETSEETIAEVGKLIENRPEVSHIKYVSAEEAWNGFKDEYLGEYAEGFDAEGDNPLKDSSNYEIYLQDVSQQGALVKYLETIESIRMVNKSDITANALSGVNRLVGYVSVGIIAILLGVSVFLISNTVTIGIAVRKEEISIMKYIGATDFFVRSPFVIEGVLIGFVGAVFPLAIIYVVYNNIIVFVIERFTVLSNFLKFLPVDDIFKILLPVSIVLGVGIGFLGSYITVRKHIRV